MTDWDYENDGYSQKVSHTLCQRLRRLNVLLIGLHRRIDESFHPEGFLTVLEVLQDTKEIILGVEHTFFIIVASERFGKQRHALTLWQK